MNKTLYFLSILLFLSCSNYNEKSFIYLSDAFHSWNKKYNFTYTSTYLNDYSLLSNEYSIDQINSDLRRFDMEISRIDKKRLSDEYLFNHGILENYLNNLIYDFDILKYNTWNLLALLNQFHDKLLLLHTLYESNEDYKNVIVDQLDIINNKIFYVMDNIIYSDINQKKYSLNVLNEINIISNSFLIQINNKDYHQIYKTLEILKNWIENDYMKLKPLSLKEIRYDLDKNARQQFGANYSSVNIRTIAEKQIYLIQIEMFNLSLHNFLKFNDEPVWLDFTDTLNVIQWGVDSLEKEIVPKSKILSTTYKIYNELIESFSKNNIPISKKSKNILFSPLFVENLDHSSFLYVPFKKIDTDNFRLKCFINTYNTKSDNSRNYFNIHLDIIESLMFSDIYFLYDELSLDNLSSKAYNIDLFIYGWKNYSQLYYIEKVSSDPKYANLKLAYLKDKLLDVLNTIICIDYYSNNSSLKTIELYMKRTSFQDDYEIENSIHSILSEGSKVMREFIGFNELVNLSYKYNNSEISDEFVNKIIDNRIFSLDMIKEKVFE